MRRPTSQQEAYSNWKRRLKGETLPMYLNEPECGYYKTRAWSRGPYIPAKIWLVSDLDEHGELTSDEFLRAEIGDKEWDAIEAWTWLAQKPISLTEFETLLKALPIVKGMREKAPTYCHV